MADKGSESPYLVVLEAEVAIHNSGARPKHADLVVLRIIVSPDIS